MKTKFFVILGILAILVGGTMGAVGMSRLDWDFSKLDTRVFTEMNYTPDAESTASIKKIKVNTSTYKLKVVKGDVISLKYFETEDNKTAISIEDGVLKIETDKWKWDWNIFHFNEYKYDFVLTVPDDIVCVFDSVDLNIELTGLNNKSMEIDSVNANITMNDCNIEMLDINSTNLDVDINGGTFGEVIIKSVNLDIDLNNVFSKTIDMDSTNIDLDGRVALDKLIIDGTNLDGDLIIVGAKSEYSVKVNALNGGMHNQTGTDSNKIIDVDTVNFGVKITFAQD